MRRVFSAKTSREKWKTANEKSYFEALDEQSGRICSRVRR